MLASRRDAVDFERATFAQVLQASDLGPEILLSELRVAQVALQLRHLSI